MGIIVSHFSLEGGTWQQKPSSGQSNVARFVVYFATLDCPGATGKFLWPEQLYQFLCISGNFRFPDLSGLPWHEGYKKYKGIGNVAVARATFLLPQGNLKYIAKYTKNLSMFLWPEERSSGQVKPSRLKERHSFQPYEKKKDNHK